MIPSLLLACLEVGADGEAAELVVEVDLAVEVEVGEVDALGHPAAAEDADDLDLVALLALGLEDLDAHVAPGGLQP